MWMTLRLVALWLLLSAGFTMAQPPELFAFDNAVGRGKWTPDEQARTLRELGYAGISYNYTNPKDLAAWQRAFAAQSLKIYGLYVHTFPDGEQPYDPALREAINLLKGSDTVIWMTLREVKDKGRNYDDACVKIVQDIAEQARANGLRVALYPHAGFTVATAAQAVRIVKLVNRPNVGASINLCHEFITNHGPDIDATLQLAAPLSTLVSINGMDVARKHYFGRLDQGDFDLADYLRQLSAAGYNGPVGLQGYKVEGDPRENLRLSMEAWKRISQQANQ
jgi:sugar phosphate isomerase/epimerase